MKKNVILISIALMSLMAMGMVDSLNGDISDDILDTTIETDFSGTYSIVDTDQTKFYDDIDELMIVPQEIMAFYGQDAMYDGNQPSYQDNGDGTVTDLVTGLMWQQDPGEKMTYSEAVSGAISFDLAGYDDWRLPSIKELYSLILFSGEDVSPEAEDSGDLNPFIDTEYFYFEYGDTSAGERIIDSQYASSTVYVGHSELGQLVFGVNFADGRIKGYGTGGMPGQEDGKLFCILYVRGNEDYGTNNYVDNNDGTITDYATGLMWQTEDSGEGMNWEDALEYSEDLEYAGYDDWRLPNVKELQSIVDYTRAPDIHGSAAIDPLFSTTSITDEGGNDNYPFFWSSTTHANAMGGSFGAYVAFGEALGWMQGSQGDLPPPPGDGEEPPPGGDLPPPPGGDDPPGGDLPPPPGGEDPLENSSEGEYQLMDVHGAGAQRSDPKSGDPADFEYGNGPQGDVVRIYNYVRCVRSADIKIEDIPPINDKPDDSEDQSIDEEVGYNDAYPIVDTGQDNCYDNSEIISHPEPGEPFYGQDAQYNGNQPSYQDNGDGTITDLVTGLIWAKDQSDRSMSWEETSTYAESLTLGGYSDWRVPSLKELWSIRDFSTGWPWVDTDYFNLVGDGSDQRQQHSWSSNYYLVDTEEAVENVAFIVNDWTGHIKALSGARYLRCVRGDIYGINDFVDNGDSTINDVATGLMWSQDDSGTGMDWETALSYAEDSTYAGYDDWRLPNVKELQSIVDYSGCLPTIDSIFAISEITNEAGNSDYPYFWTSTTNPYIDPREAETQDDLATGTLVTLLSATQWTVRATTCMVQALSVLTPRSKEVPREKEHHDSITMSD